MDIAAIRKALTPFVLSFVTAVAQWIVTGDLNVAELRTIAAGALVAVAVYFVPNAPADDKLGWHWNEDGEPVPDA